VSGVAVSARVPVTTATVGSRSGTSTSDLLRLGTIGAYLMFALFTATNIVFVVFNPLPNSIPSYVALFVVTAAALVVARPGPDPLPLPLAILVSSVAPISAALISWNLPTSGSPGYENWHLGACAFLMFFLVLRNRPLWAWIGLVAMAAVTIGWTVDVGQGVLSGVNQVDRHFGILLIGTLFNFAFQRTSARIRLIQIAEQDRLVADAVADEATATRRRYAAALGESTREMLLLITRRGNLDEADQRECLLIEASLRDRLRGRSFYRHTLIDEVRAARIRGVDVVLLDDRGPADGTIADEELRDAVAAVVAEELATLDAGKLTARMLPRGRSVIATVTTNRGSGISTSFTVNGAGRRDA
jgi:hypothetical protein